MKIKDKKIVCLVILGVSIVSLLSAIVSGFVAGIVDLASDIKYLIKEGSSSYMLLSIATLLQVFCGAAFAAVFFFCKKKRNVVNIVLSATLAGLFFIFNTVFGIIDYFSGAYNSCMSYISICLTLIVSSVIMIVSDRLVRKYNADIAEAMVNPQNGQPNLNNGSSDSDKNN